MEEVVTGKASNFLIDFESFLHLGKCLFVPNVIDLKIN